VRRSCSVARGRSIGGPVDAFWRSRWDRSGHRGAIACWDFTGEVLVAVDVLWERRIQRMTARTDDDGGDRKDAPGNFAVGVAGKFLSRSADIFGTGKVAARGILDLYGGLPNV